MTFAESVEMWEYLHNQDYMNNVIVDTNGAVDKNALLDFLLYEYQNMKTVDGNCDTFHDHFINFFAIHRWNIDQLADTLNLDYDTLGNVDWTMTTDYDRGQNVHTTEERDIDTVENRVEQIVEDRDETINKNTVWTEQGSDESEDINYVSAFNDGSDDSKHHRDTHEGSYNKQGDEQQNTVDAEDTTTDDKEDTTTVTNDDLEAQQDLGENIDVVQHKIGHEQNFSFQELIEQERKQAQFNIYKWIAKHFCKEMLIAVW